MKKLHYVTLSLLTFVLSIIGFIISSNVQAQEGFNWQSDWAVSRGYKVEVDSEGYQLPSAIAFVPRPGDGPTDPLYFVLELKGVVKVVANDRSVHTFAEDFFKLGPVQAYNSSDSNEVGMAGICLEPERGYVFVTFAYQDSGRALRNNIVRFQATPGTFSLLPESQVEFSDIFLPELSNASHQIGSCEVNNDLLYVSVGDGGQPSTSQQIDSTLGKVLRMTLDGNPVEQNPFYEDASRGNPANYTWAYGFRNPFGLTIVQDRVFVADSGPSVDRFLIAEEGENYLWDGSNNSIGTRAISVLSGGIGLSRVDHNEDSKSGFPRGFFLNVSGNSENLESPPQIIFLDYDIENDKLWNVPKPFLRYRGDTNQVLAGLSFGPDGLYFAPLLPNRDGMSAILKMIPDATESYPFLLEDELDVDTLLRERGCTGCHSTKKGGTGNVGPNLFPPSLFSRLNKRLNSEEYAQAVEKVDKIEEEPFVSFRAARHEILEAEDTEQIRLWIKNRALEPKFDNPNAMMPNLGLSSEEAELIADYFISKANLSNNIVDTMSEFLPSPVRLRHLIAFSAGGFLAGIGFLILFRLIIRAVGFRRGWRQ